MVNDGSLGGNIASDVFDLNSQKGVIRLLASVRASTISPAQKNEIRDLVFQYMNGDMDHTIRISLEQKLSNLNITSVTPLSLSINEKRESNYPFGTSRPAPFFPVNNFTKTSKLAQVSKVTPAPVVQVDVPLSSPDHQQLATPTIPTQKAPFEPQIKHVDVAPPISVTQQTEAPVEPTYEPEPRMDPAQSLQRIKEIKSLVNEKIGNPVNLVDINNEVGREYMSAMLDAMKKLNTGSTAVSAMKRLEDAYFVVEKTLSEHQEKSGSKEDVPKTHQVTPPNETVFVSEPVSENEIIPEIIPEIAPEIIEPQVPLVAIEMQIEPESILPDSVPEVADANNDSNEVQSLPIKSGWSEEESDEPLEVITPVVSEESSWNAEGDTLQVSDIKAHSLAEEKIKPRKPEDLPLSSAIETSSVSGDPLYTREVDDGLQQLLSEWPIFKKSGLFGTGPKGREHPLFIKVSSLQIPLLLAGRFEGATQEIKQSITDYMNGWRYEQGIIYEHGENFEHYLRRVIRHIIDLQNRKRSS